MTDNGTTKIHLLASGKKRCVINPTLMIFFPVPSMQFEKIAYTVKEKDRALHIPIIRTGDLSYKSSVRCFTRTMSAMVMDDFEERRNADVSRVVFFKGEKVLFSPAFTYSRMHVISMIHIFENDSVYSV